MDSRKLQLRFDFLPLGADYKNLALTDLKFKLTQFSGLGCQVTDESIVACSGGSGRIIRACCCRLYKIVYLHFLNSAACLISLLKCVFNHHFVKVLYD